jgi:hypothetical protein
MNLNWDQNPHRLTRLAASVVVLALIGGVAAANKQPLQQQAVTLGDPVPGSAGPTGPTPLPTPATSAGDPTPSTAPQPGASPGSHGNTPTPTPTPAATGSRTPTPTPGTTTTPKPTATPTPTSAPTPTPTPPPTYTYRNGTYSTTAAYTVPGYTETVGVSLTITNDSITATSATNMSNNGESSFYQNDFISKYSSSVVGKKLATLSLGKIGASSLTPNGFNAAVAKIRVMAK